MLLSRSLFVAIISAPFLAFAQSSGGLALTILGSFQITAGEPVTITWEGESSGPIEIILRSGDASNLAAGTVIGSNLPNTGSFTYTAPETITAGSDYALQIVDTDDPANNNYSGMFVLDSTNTVASSTSIVSLAAPTASSDIPTSTLAPTARPSAFPTTQGSSSASSTSSTTGSSSMSTSMSSTTASSTSSSSTSSDAAATMESTTQDGGAPRATAAGAMLGAIALAALAL